MPVKLGEEVPHGIRFRPDRTAPKRVTSSNAYATASPPGHTATRRASDRGSTTPELRDHHDPWPIG
jgi:hypothetical protein